MILHARIRFLSNFLPVSRAGILRTRTRSPRCLGERRFHSEEGVAGIHGQDRRRGSPTASNPRPQAGLSRHCEAAARSGGPSKRAAAISAASSRAPRGSPCGAGSGTCSRETAQRKTLRQSRPAGRPGLRPLLSHLLLLLRPALQLPRFQRRLWKLPLPLHWRPLPEEEIPCSSTGRCTATARRRRRRFQAVGLMHEVHPGVRRFYAVHF